MTDCNLPQLVLQGFPGRRELVARFDGGEISSDGGAVLLHQADRVRQLVGRFAECFVDHRHPQRREHTVEQLLRQRVFALALGYEDLVDHDELRREPLLAALVGKADPTGGDRRRSEDRGRPLAGKSTLNRLEWGVSGEAEDDRYRRIAVDPAAVDAFFVDAFLAAHSEPPEQIVLDLDATDDPLHGAQEGRFFHGYYGHYCYLPLYVFCGSHLLCARLRRSNIDASAGAVEEVERIVSQIRARWPDVAIVLRGDSGFAREALMGWCEQHGVDYVFGLARNSRLEEALEPGMEAAEAICAETGEPARVYQEIRYRTLDSWSRSRRVVGKAEILERGPNPRFVVTSLAIGEVAAAMVYEQLYCARGEMENRIKEQQLYLFADRTSARLMRVNQLRLWLSSVAYLLLDEVRRIALVGTSLARARCDTIRLKLLKIGARIRISVRRITCSLSSSHPYQELFLLGCQRLIRAGPATL
ncbi:MAG TPA: IS1380 family transposase [Thermoanaerobaculia bacterium]|nr:IS1380 family transposase [Thermoanaerobaculia bacterium]